MPRSFLVKSKSSQLPPAALPDLTIPSPPGECTGARRSRCGRARAGGTAPGAVDSESRHAISQEPGKGSETHLLPFLLPTKFGSFRASSPRLPRPFALALGSGGFRPGLGRAERAQVPPSGGRTSEPSGPTRPNLRPHPAPPLRRRHLEHRRGEGGAPGPCVPRVSADRSSLTEPPCPLAAVRAACAIGARSLKILGGLLPSPSVSPGRDLLGAPGLGDGGGGRDPALSTNPARLWAQKCQIDGGESFSRGGFVFGSRGGGTGFSRPALASSRGRLLGSQAAGPGLFIPNIHWHGADERKKINESFLWAAMLTFRYLARDDCLQRARIPEYRPSPSLKQRPGQSVKKEVSLPLKIKLVSAALGLAEMGPQAGQKISVLARSSQAQIGGLFYFSFAGLAWRWGPVPVGFISSQQSSFAQTE